VLFEVGDAGCQRRVARFELGDAHISFGELLSQPGILADQLLEGEAVSARGKTER
jgi:hypothetical protein